MRDRLIELIQKSVGGCARNWAEIIADHLLANGVIVPPCKVGDLVYMPWEWNGRKGVACLKVTSLSNILDFGWSCGTDFNTDDDGYAEKYNCGRFNVDDFGKIVFLSREEAEKALKEGAEK